MKTLTALFLLLSLVLPVGLVTQAMAASAPVQCAVVDDSGSACCEPAVTHCCCRATPAAPEQPTPPVPQLPSSTAAKDIAASLPHLLVFAELPRLSDSPARTSPFSDRVPSPTAPPVRLCVLRCSLLI